MLQNNTSKAVETYNTILRTFDKLQYKYERNDKQLTVNSIFNGEDLIIPLCIKTGECSVHLDSSLPFIVPYIMRDTAAVAVCAINAKLINGRFVFDYGEGSISFTMSISNDGCILREELFEYMIMTTLSTVEKHNHLLYKLAEEVINIKEFLSAIAN